MDHLPFFSFFFFLPFLLLLGLFNDLWTHEPMSTQSSVNRITSTVQTPNSYHNPDPFQQPKTQQKGWCLDEP
jgi:hypothetical protein